MNASSHLAHLQQRRSVREFTDREVPREVLERLFEAATSAPSPSNRQPWRFVVVTDRKEREAIAQAVQEVVGSMKAVIEKSHHAEDFARYGDFFFEPLQRAPVVIAPLYRTHTDLIERLLLSGGSQPGDFVTPGAMQGELACTAGAVMNLLNQAHAEGLGACWMAGPTIARASIRSILEIRAPWTLLGMVAVGWPTRATRERRRKPTENSVVWR